VPRAETTESLYTTRIRDYNVIFIKRKKKKKEKEKEKHHWLKITSQYSFNDRVKRILNK